MRPPAPRGAPPAPLPVQTILLVDDNPRLTPLVVKLLEVLGFRSVEIASDAQGARMALELLPVALVICDMHLPGEDGLSLLRWMRANAATRGMPFIMTEETFSFEEIIAAHELGADGILLKPYESELFRKKITHAVSGAARRQRKRGDSRLSGYETNQTFAQSLWGMQAQMSNMAQGS